MTDDPSAVVERYTVLICRHCKEAEDRHVQGKCLFDSTYWTPMSLDAWVTWRQGMWSAVCKSGIDDIRTKLDQPLLALRLHHDIIAYGRAHLDIDTHSSPGELIISRVVPPHY